MAIDQSSRESGWRAQIVDALTRLFSNDHIGLYGLEHACRVEKIAQERFASLNGASEQFDLVLLRCAALLHDIGFSQRTPYWTLEGVEHVSSSLDIARTILAETPNFEANSEMIQVVLALIERHDTTTYSYPSLTRAGATIHCSQLDDRYFTAALGVLREADATVHAQSDCVEAAISEWLDKDVPLLSLNESSLAMTWCWMESALCNVRLLGRRALIDAYTKAGRQEAEGIYKRLEQWIEGICQKQGVEYVPELFKPQYLDSARDRLGNTRIETQLIASHGWLELVSALRDATLKYDKQMLPYQTSQFSSKTVPFEQISPMARYVMKVRLDETMELYDALMVKYGLSLFDLCGLIDFRYNSPMIQTIGPPVIETYYENHPNALVQGEVIGLVDGLHRCFSARQLGFEQIRAVCIANAAFPLVPLPTTWDLIRTYNQPPQPEMKRFYRFSQIEELPLIRYPNSSLVDEENYQYFFFRDLSEMGSKGRRDFHEYDEERAD